MSLAEDYKTTKAHLESREACEGSMCRGWHLSDFDTWHRCGCRRGLDIDPECQQEMDPEELKRLWDEKDAEDEEARMSSPLDTIHFAVKFDLNGKRWAVAEPTKNIRNAYDLARIVAKQGHPKVSVVRLHTVGEMENALIEVDRLRDWSSD